MKKSGNLKLQMLIPIIVIAVLVIFVDVSIRYITEDNAMTSVFESIKAANIQSHDDLVNEVAKIEAATIKIIGMELVLQRCRRNIWKELTPIWMISATI